MDSTDGALIIQTMIAAIEIDPGQFTFDVNVQSTETVASHTGGNGFVTNPVMNGNGLAAASHFSNIDVTIARSAATNVIDEQMNSALTLLGAIVQEMQKRNPNKETLGRLGKRLSASVLPVVITAVVAAVLKSTFNI